LNRAPREIRRAWAADPILSVTLRAPLSKELLATSRQLGAPGKRIGFPRSIAGRRPVVRLMTRGLL